QRVDGFIAAATANDECMAVISGEHPDIVIRTDVVEAISAIVNGGSGYVDSRLVRAVTGGGEADPGVMATDQLCIRQMLPETHHLLILVHFAVAVAVAGFRA